MCDLCSRLWVAPCSKVGVCLQKALCSFMDTCFPPKTQMKDHKGLVTSVAPVGRCSPCPGYHLGHLGVATAVYTSLSLEIKSPKTRMASYFSECPLSLSWGCHPGGGSEWWQNGWMLRGEAGKGYWTPLLESATQGAGCLETRRQGGRPELPISPHPYL